nr:hypothetical protein Abuela_35 [Pectobacterium phage Abuela]
MQYRQMHRSRLLNRSVLLMLLTLSLNGCKSASMMQSAESSQVAAIPELPAAAKQGIRPDHCLPSCLEKLTQQRENMRKKLTGRTTQE